MTRQAIERALHKLEQMAEAAAEASESYARSAFPVLSMIATAAATAYQQAVDVVEEELATTDATIEEVIK